MNDYNFGNFLCELRESKGLTQADIAKELGVTPAAVSKWENGSSKPRVEILFQLAKILDVRSEELMAGHRFETETLKPEIVKQINEQCAYLRRVDSYNTTGVKVRRMLAWIIDWNIIGGAVLLMLLAFISFGESLLQSNQSLGVLSMMLIILLYPIGFMLRDFIFGGRSIGKRITQLVVLDKFSGLPANPGKRILRNVFLPALQIDAIVMLVSGATIGDRVAHTFVVHKKVQETNTEDFSDDVSKINSYVKPKATSRKKTIVVVISVVILFFALLISGVLLLLSAKKDTEEYKIAYQYLVESAAFSELGVEESKIWMNQYSLTTNNYAKTAEIGFMVNSKSFHVVCHEENGVWKVCAECTNFD